MRESSANTRQSRTGPRDVLRRYFERNPSDELTIEGAMCKFGLTRKQVLAAVAVLRLSGHVRTLHVITPGPQVPGSVAALEAAKGVVPPRGAA